MITSSMELPADVFTIVGITWFGRRWSATLSLLLCGLTMVVCAFVKGQNIFIVLISDMMMFLIRVEHHPDNRISHWTVLLHLRHECWSAVHRGADANLSEGPGHSSGQCYVHGLLNGLTVHCILGKVNTKQIGNNKLHFTSPSSQKKLPF